MAKDVSVAAFATEPEAAMWAELLRSNGIRSVVVFTGASEGPWAQPWLVGNFELRVLEADVARTRALLKNTHGRANKTRRRR